MKEPSLLNKRLIAIGDVHGCHIELKKLLDMIKPDPQDELWMVGDGFDRAGPTCAFEVYKIIKKYGIKYIYGNHDSELKSKVTKGEEIQKPWYKDWWNSFDSEAKDWFLQTEQYYKYFPEFKCLLVHAGIDPDLYYTKTNTRTLCTIGNINSSIPADYYKIGKPRYYKLKKFNSDKTNYWTKHFKEDGMYRDINIVYGHAYCAPDDNVTRSLKDVYCWGIDSGCCRGEFLSAFVYELGVHPTICVVKSAKDYYWESYKNK